jgi:hypothetical protein
MCFWTFNAVFILKNLYCKGRMKVSGQGKALPNDNIKD